MDQPYLTDAIAHQPLHMFDVANAKADVCQILREALERHKLPDAVRDHYDYRYLQLPEALAQYAFRLVAYGVPYDVSYPDASLITSESAEPNDLTLDYYANISFLLPETREPVVQG